MADWMLKNGVLEEYTNLVTDEEEWSSLEIFQVGITVFVHKGIYQIVFKFLKMNIFANNITDLMLAYKEYITPYVQSHAADKQYSISLRR